MALLNVPISTGPFPGTSGVHTLPHWGRGILLTPAHTSCTLPKDQFCPVQAGRASRAHRRSAGDLPAPSASFTHPCARHCANAGKRPRTRQPRAQKTPLKWNSRLVAGEGRVQPRKPCSPTSHAAEDGRHTLPKKRPWTPAFLATGSCILSGN